MVSIHTLGASSARLKTLSPSSNGLSFFRDFDISMNVIGTTAPVAHCELSARANRRSGEVNFEGSLAETEVLATSL